jgi:hypothetical protein
MSSTLAVPLAIHIEVDREKSISNKSRRYAASVLRDSQQSPTFLQRNERVVIARIAQASGDRPSHPIAIRGRPVKGLSLADHTPPDATH